MNSISSYEGHSFLALLSAGVVWLGQETGDWNKGEEEQKKQKNKEEVQLETTSDETELRKTALTERGREEL
jgi:hypothetical protein